MDASANISTPLITVAVALIGVLMGVWYLSLSLFTSLAAGRARLKRSYTRFGPS